MAKTACDYEDRYRIRHDTWRAYVDVRDRTPEARQHFKSWAMFSQAANAEPKQRELGHDMAAERLMKSAGYEIGPPTARGARTWRKVGSRRLQRGCHPDEQRAVHGSAFVGCGLVDRRREARMPSAPRTPWASAPRPSFGRLGRSSNAGARYREVDPPRARSRPIAGTFPPTATE